MIFTERSAANPTGKSGGAHRIFRLRGASGASAISARSVTASLRAMHDSPLALESFYQTQAAAGLAESLDELIARIQTVTADDVCRAAQKAVPDTVYFLKGAGA